MKISGGSPPNLPLRGRGTAAAVEEGRYGSELYVFSYRSRALGPSSVRANALPAPPEGELLTFPFGEGGPPQRWKRGVMEVSCTSFLTALAH